VIPPLVGFFGALVLTLVCLGGAVLTGLKARRRPHLMWVAGSVALLVTSIYYAIKLGEHYDLESAGWITPVHMLMARVNTAAYLLPVITGLRTMKNPAGRKLHGKVAFTVILFTLGTAATGAAMLYLSTPIPQ
jgi:hypothetical protein